MAKSQPQDPFGIAPSSDLNSLADEVSDAANKVAGAASLPVPDAVDTYTNLHKTANDMRRAAKKGKKK